ncbi:MAG: hypothetical protein ACI3XX_05205 [Eubacteriales bacterium]
MLNANDAENYKYDISLITQLGKRHGTMLVKIINDNIEGILDILGKSHRCIGKIQKDGLCSIKGKLKTLLSVFEYSAKGFINEDKIELELKYKHGNMSLYGQRIK